MSAAAEGFDWQAARAQLERARSAIEASGRSDEQIEKLYRRRAELLAQPAAGTSAAGDAVETIMVFRLGAERYAAPLAAVAEVIARPRIAAAPGAPAEIAGLIQVRGEIRVVWDLRQLLGLPSPGLPGDGPPGENNDGPGVVLLLRTAAGEAGALADEVEDIRVVQEDEKRPALEKAAHAAWMTADLVTVLDTESLLPGETEENGNA